MICYPAAASHGAHGLCLDRRADVGRRLDVLGVPQAVSVCGVCEDGVGEVCIRFLSTLTECVCVRGGGRAYVHANIHADKYACMYQCLSRQPRSSNHGPKVWLQFCCHLSVAPVASSHPEEATLLLLATSIPRALFAAPPPSKRADKVSCLRRETRQETSYDLLGRQKHCENEQSCRELR